MSISILFLSCTEKIKIESDENSNILKIGILPDTQGGMPNIAAHPMRAVLDKLHSEDVDIIIPVGDLTEGATPQEFEHWTSIAEEFRDQGIEFLPLMGNHETAWGSNVEWIEFVKQFIPEDAIHMSGVEYGNYYVVRNNVLVIILKHGHLAPAFEWVKSVVYSNNSETDHIIIASHDGLVGSKNGQTKSMISSKGTDLLYDNWDEIRSFYSEHDIVWVQGHDHIYQRSQISAPIWVNPTSWNSSSGNYRLQQYTQIISGSASYKGYNFRFGEREKIQDIIQMRSNTMKNGSLQYDVNASVFLFNDHKIDYKSYVTTHTIQRNEDGPKELETPEWILLDKFTRTKNRCERIVYPSSIPPSTRIASTLDSRFHTNDCFANDGSKARIIDGENKTFNRFDSSREVIRWNEGFSRAESVRDLARLMYQYMFQYNQPWSPNLNSAQRILIDEDEFAVIVPETTIDVKKHLTLSWLAKTEETSSDILIVDGTQIHTGMYTNSDGMVKDIEIEKGQSGSQPDGSAKEPVELNEYVTKDWDLENAVSDPYVLQFTGAMGMSEDLILAYNNGHTWVPFTSEECIIQEPYQSSMLNKLDSGNSDACKDGLIVGKNQNSWWVVLNFDAEVALIEK